MIMYSIMVTWGDLKADPSEIRGDDWTKNAGAKFHLVVIGVAFIWVMHYVLNYSNDQWVAGCILQIVMCEIM